MKELSATITSKGQVTIPAEVRTYLGLKQGDKIAFVLADEGIVQIKAPKYTSIASLAGAAGRLEQPRSLDELREMAREDALEHDFPHRP